MKAKQFGTVTWKTSKKLNIGPSYDIWKLAVRSLCTILVLSKVHKRKENKVQKLLDLEVIDAAQTGRV